MHQIGMTVKLFDLFFVIVLMKLFEIRSISIKYNKIFKIITKTLYELIYSKYYVKNITKRAFGQQNKTKKFFMVPTGTTNVFDGSDRVV